MFFFHVTRKAHWILSTETIALSPTWDQHFPSIPPIGTLSLEVTFSYPLRIPRFRLLINSRNTSPNLRSCGFPSLLQPFLPRTLSPPMVSLCYLGCLLLPLAQLNGFLPTSLTMTLLSQSVSRPALLLNPPSPPSGPPCIQDAICMSRNHSLWRFRKRTGYLVNLCPLFDRSPLELPAWTTTTFHLMCILASLAHRGSTTRIPMTGRLLPLALSKAS